jgi:hypothetical protein
MARGGPPALGSGQEAKNRTLTCYEMLHRTEDEHVDCIQLVQERGFSENMKAGNVINIKF